MGIVVVDVMLKSEILDPQGQAVAGALPRLGFNQFTDVRQGKRFVLTVEGEVTDQVLAASRAAASTWSVTSPSTVRTNRLPWRTSVNWLNPSRGRAPATAWPWGSRISDLSMTSTTTIPMRGAPQIRGLVRYRLVRRVYPPATAARDRPSDEGPTGQGLVGLDVLRPGGFDDVARERWR